MKNTPQLPLVLLCASFGMLSAGCVHSPATAQPTSYASMLGDRANVELDEIVISLPLQGSRALYQNLHVSLAVIINPVRETSGSPYEIESLVRRLDARLRARLVDVLTTAGEQSLSSTVALRHRIVAEANPILEKALANWKYAPDYKVELVVSGLYWTDASVGRPLAHSRGWF
jgi:hypothetical protein